MLKHIILLLCFLSLSMAGWWNATWNKCIPITITGTYPDLNYTFPLTLTTANNYAAMLNNGDDLRFFEGNCTNPNVTAGTMYYWVEKWNTSGDSYVHVKPINPSDTSLAMYYNNSAASATSNITTAFMFGDDFDGSALSSLWINTNVTSAIGLITNMTINTSARNYYAASKFFVSDQSGGVERTRFRTAKSTTLGDGDGVTDHGLFSNPGALFYFGAWKNSYPWNTDFKYFSSINSSNVSWNVSYYNNGSNAYVGTTNSYTPTAAATNIDIYAGDTGGSTATKYMSISDGKVNIAVVRNGGGNITMYWFYMRTTTTSPPTFAFGTEENVTSLNTMIGNQYNWTWSSTTGSSIIRHGNAYNWSWGIFSPSSGNLTPNGTSTNWTWVSE